LAALAVLLVLGASWWSPPADASTVRALSLAELTRKAELIVVGTPQRAQSRRHVDGRLLVTDVSVLVEKVQKGTVKPGDSLVVTVLGGELDGVALSVPGEAVLPPGQRSLVFLYRATRSRDLRVVGMAQGSMAIEADPTGTVMVIPGGSGSALVERGDDGRLHPSPAALMQPEPIDELRGKVQQLVAAQAR
jgi:hypothetical protein